MSDDRIKKALPDLGKEHTPPALWQTDVWRRIRREQFTADALSVVVIIAVVGLAVLLLGGGR